MSTTAYYTLPIRHHPPKVVMWENDSHSLGIGYLMWLFGFTGAHRFYYGRPLTGLLWFCTFGLLGIGWLIDAFLLPSMDRDADYRYVSGRISYSIAWVLLVFAGFLGLHRFYRGKVFSGLVYLLTFGLLMIGVIFDVFTLNEQIDVDNRLYRTGIRSY